MGKKMQSVGICPQSDSDSDVREPRRDCSRDFEMSADFELVSADALGLEAELAKRLIENRARSRAIFAVDDSKTRSLQVGETANPKRVAGRRRKPQFPPGTVHD